MKSKQIAAFLASLSVIAMGASGCGEATEPTSSKESSPASSTQSSTSTTNSKIVASGNGSEIPWTKEPITLKYFHNLDGKVSASMSSNAEIACYKEMEKITGVQIEWVHPPVGQEIEQLNLMIASQDLPDMAFMWGWKNIGGGPYNLIDNRNIIKLNELTEQYAPNYLKTIQKNDQLKRQTQLDDGTLYNFMQINSEGHRANAGGLQIREDWLEKLGLSLPQTMDEMEAVLKAFQTGDPNGNGKSDELPFIATGGGGLRGLLNVYGVSYGMSLDGGKVQFGPMTAAYKE